MSSPHDENETKYALAELTEIIEANETAVLDFQGVAWEDLTDFATEFARFHLAVMTNTSITTIHATLDEVEVPMAFPFVNTLCRHLPRARHLKLQLSMGDDELNEEFDGTLLIRGSEKFHSIVVEGEGGSENILFSSFKNHHWLQELTIPASTYQGSFYDLVHLPPSLRVLSVSDAFYDHMLLPEMVNFYWQSDRDPHATSAIATRLSSLRELRLNVEFVSDTVTAFASALERMQHLEILELDIEITDVETAAEINVVSSAIAKLRTLVSLSVRHTGFFDTTESSTALLPLSIGDLVRSNPRLHKLSLNEIDATNTYVPGGGYDTVSPLGNLSQLTELTVRSAQWSMDDAIDTITSLSAVESRLTKLHFQWGELDTGREGAPLVKSLMSLVASAPSFQECTLEPGFSRSLGSVPPIRIGPYQDFVKEVALRCYNMENAIFPFLDEGSRQQVETICRLNRAGRRYLLQNNRTKADCVRVLSQVSCQLDDVYTHLRENSLACLRSEEETALGPHAITQRN